MRSCQRSVLVLRTRDMPDGISNHIFGPGCCKERGLCVDWRAYAGPAARPGLGAALAKQRAKPSPLPAPRSPTACARRAAGGGWGVVVGLEPDRGDVGAHRSRTAHSTADITDQPPAASKPSSAVARFLLLRGCSGANPSLLLLDNMDTSRMHDEPVQDSIVMLQLVISLKEYCAEYKETMADDEG